MAGLLQQGMQPAQPQGGPPPSPQARPGQPPQGQPQGQPQGGRDPGVDMDPEQGGQQREQLVNAMLESLYGPALKQVRDQLDQRRDQPAEAIGHVVSQLLLTAYQALSEQGKTIPPGVMIQAAMVVAQAVGEMAARRGVIGEEDGDTIEAGFMVAMARFGKAASKQMGPGQRQRYAEMIRALRDAKSKATGQGGQQQPAQPPQQPPQAPRMAGGR